MSLTAAKLMILTGEQFACVKITGRANFATSVDFKNVLNGFADKGYPYWVIELSECPLMDSTFLGVLAEFGVKSTQLGCELGSRLVELRNPNERVVELLESLGVLHLFRTCQAEMPCGDAIESCSCEPSREALTEASLEAHRALMDINPENVARFQEVAKFLSEDLQRLKSKSSRQ